MTNRFRLILNIRAFCLVLCLSSPLGLCAQSSELKENARELPKADLSIYKSAIDHPFRTANHRGKDSSRKPIEILPFTLIKPGDTVLELGAGGGYTTELLALTVGNKGKVFAQGLSSQRIASLPQVNPLRRHLLYELPEVLAETAMVKGDLDAVVIFFALHDFYLSERIDKQSLFNTLHTWLSQEGTLVILDNAAAKDAGTSVNRRLHRIGENFVISQMKEFGFELDGTSQALRNSSDNHTKPWSNFGGFHDRFALRFRKK